MRPIDADNHYYETDDCFTRFMEPKYRHLAAQWKDIDGEKVFCIGDRPHTFLKPTYPMFERVSAAGALAAALRKGDHRADAGDETSIETPAAYTTDRDARVELIHSQGLDGAIILPTLGVTVEHFMRNDPIQTFANLRAFNSWIDDQWGFNYKDTIYGVPLLSLLDIDLAVEELDRVLKMGAKAVHLRPGPQGGKSPADPSFDAFWSRVNEAGIPVAFHISESSYNEMFSVAWGEDPNPRSHRQSAFQWTNFFGDRPMIDTISSMIFMNFFERFPRVNAMSIENGSLWVPYLVKAMDKMKGMGRNGPWPGGYVKGKPSLIFKRHVFVSPYFEEDVIALADLIGHSQILFGSDYPHMEGLASPLDFQESIQGLPIDQQEDIMQNNIRRVLGTAV